MDDASNTTDIKYLNVDAWLLFPPMKLSGYAPVVRVVESL